MINDEQMFHVTLANANSCPPISLYFWTVIQNWKEIKWEFYLPAALLCWYPLHFDIAFPLLKGMIDQ